MSDTKPFRSVRIWRQSYVALKMLAVIRGVSLVQLVDDLVNEARRGGLTGAKAQHESVRFQSPPTNQQLIQGE